MMKTTYFAQVILKGTPGEHQRGARFYVLFLADKAYWLRNGCVASLPREEVEEGDAFFIEESWDITDTMTHEMRITFNRLMELI